ncbi:hypothetical protein ACCO45_013815 [Purpureocillium lilacinum]|uniref:Uncharacterized protein n=1 Tax=Purpureocillium lilacinum TaxID=33203 RepID=A0ACC4D7Y3_PURLI
MYLDLGVSCLFHLRSIVYCSNHGLLRLCSNTKTPLKLKHWGPITDGWERLMRDKDGKCSKFGAGQIFHKDEFSVSWQFITGSYEERRVCVPLTKLAHHALPKDN